MNRTLTANDVQVAAAIMGLLIVIGVTLGAYQQHSLILILWPFIIPVAALMLLSRKSWIRDLLWGIAFTATAFFSTYLLGGLNPGFSRIAAFASVTSMIGFQLVKQILILYRNHTADNIHAKRLERDQRKKH